MTEVEIVARAIARMAHAGQKDTVTGDDYLLHVQRVVDMVDGEDERAVAWLHDVLEDSAMFTAFDILNAGIPKHIVDAVMLLTRKPPFNYSDYIDSLIDAGNGLALEVKRADLADHLRPNCPARLRSRYEAALPLVESAIADTGEGVTP